MRTIPWVAVDEPTMRFGAELARPLSEPARRWLLHSVDVNTPMYTRVDLELEGHLKIGTWRPFTAHLMVRPHHGYRWSVSTHIGGVRVDGLESMSPAIAHRTWEAAGLVPVLRTSGADLLNSAAGRLAADSVFVPTAFDRATWEPSVDPDSAFATWRIGSRVDRVRLDVAPSGRLRSVSLRRWGSPPGASYGRHPFSMRFEQEVSYDGVTIPRTLTAAWQVEGRPAEDVLRAQVTSARFS